MIPASYVSMRGDSRYAAPGHSRLNPHEFGADHTDAGDLAESIEVDVPAGDGQAGVKRDRVEVESGGPAWQRRHRV